MDGLSRIMNLKVVLIITFFLYESCNENAKYVIRYTDDFKNEFVEIEMVDSVRNGLTRRYNMKNADSPRVLIESCMYVDGKRNGTRKLYDSNGRLLKEFNYLNGLVDGQTKFYYQNGRIELLNMYSMDTVFHVQEFDSLGRIILDDGLILGPHVSLFQNNKLIEEDETVRPGVQLKFQLNVFVYQEEQINITLVVSRLIAGKDEEILSKNYHLGEEEWKLDDRFVIKDKGKYKMQFNATRSVFSGQANVERVTREFTVE